MHFNYNIFQVGLMHSVEKKELICENRSSKIEKTQKRLLRIIHSSHKEENLEQHDTNVNVSQIPAVYVSNENALHLNYYNSALPFFDALAPSSSPLRINI